MTYFGTQSGGYKGTVAAKTKDKMQDIHFTECYAMAVIDSGIFPHEMFLYSAGGDMLTFYELWENAADDVFADVTGYVYTAADRVRAGENVNGGYSSLHPYEITGVNEINVKAECERLVSDGRLVISRYADCDDGEKRRRDGKIQRFIQRYGIENKSGKYAEILRNRCGE